jgi:hypothetical protein
MQGLTQRHDGHVSNGGHAAWRVPMGGTRLCEGDGGPPAATTRRVHNVFRYSMSASFSPAARSVPKGCP